MSILGTLLTVGMIFTVVCNLVVLPALLDQVGGRRSASEPGAPGS
jgi:predicted RND superfamily exporter protein